MSFVYTEEGTTLHSIFTLCLPDVMTSEKDFLLFQELFKQGKV